MPGPFRGDGGVVSLIGFAAVVSLIAFIPWFVGEVLQSVGVPDTTFARVVLIACCLGSLVGLAMFEVARDFAPASPWRQAWVYWDTTRRTILDSLVAPLLWILLLASLAFVVFAVAGARPAIAAAYAESTLTHFATGDGLKAAAAAISLAAAFVAARNLSRYLFAGRSYLVNSLAKFAPSDPAALAETPLPHLRFYHGVLRFSGAIAFTCELTFQVLAFGIVTWGIATALPQAALFANPETLSLSNAILFWVDRVFALVDGQDIFGFSFSPLAANKAVWLFGFALLFFKLFALGMIVKLFQDSLTLRPRDISKNWGEALDGAPRANPMREEPQHMRFGPRTSR
jgi:hypothetical protein